jgi:threonyl-tRNA synthetase
MLVIGDKEEDEHQVSLRRHGEGDTGSVSVSELAERLTAEIVQRA